MTPIRNRRPVLLLRLQHPRRRRLPDARHPARLLLQPQRRLLGDRLPRARHLRPHAAHPLEGRPLRPGHSHGRAERAPARRARLRLRPRLEPRREGRRKIRLLPQARRAVHPRRPHAAVEGPPRRLHRRGPRPGRLRRGPRHAEVPVRLRRKHPVHADPRQRERAAERRRPQARRELQRRQRADELRRAGRRLDRHLRHHPRRRRQRPHPRDRRGREPTRLPPRPLGAPHRGEVRGRIGVELPRERPRPLPLQRPKS